MVSHTIWCRVLLVACTLCMLPSTKTEGRLCEYGSLPGKWVEAGRYNKHWQVFQPECHLDDLVAGHVATATQHAQQDVPEEPLGILLLGDSNERRLVTMLCGICGIETKEFNIVLDGPDGAAVQNTCNSYEKRNCHSCTLPSLRLAKEAVWGLTDGPYHKDRVGSADKRAEKAFQLFQSQHGRQPDLVVIQSALWDLASEWSRNGNNQPNLLKSEDLSNAWVQAWVGGASKVVQQIKAVDLNRTVIAWRTSAFPQVVECGSVEGWHKHPRMGQHSHIAQLNAAGRYLASTHGVRLVDVEAMTVGFNAPEEYLADTHHHKEFIDYAILNIYLHLIKDAKSMLGSTS